MEIGKGTRGRPRKFGRPARAVTVTLPDDIVARLTSVDRDLGRAVVKLVEQTAPKRRTATPPAELTQYGSRSVILVTPISALRRLPGVELVPLPNGQALISFNTPGSIADLELLVRDCLDDDGNGPRDKETLHALADILKSSRRSKRVAMEERRIIVLRLKRTARRPQSQKS